VNRPPKFTVVTTLALALTSALTIVGCSSGPVPTQEEELPTHPLQINLLGNKSEVPVDSQGRLESEMEVSSTDNEISLSLAKGATVLDKDGKPLYLIQVTINPSPPPPPEDARIVSPVYDLAPQLATLSPQLLLSLGYEPERLPEGLRDNDLYIGFYDGADWRKLLYKRVDTKSHSVTTQLSNFDFTSFAILGPKELALPASPTPVEGTTVGNLAPDFQVQDVDGKPVSLSELRGKPAILNFWATWCGPCVHEMPYLQQVCEEWSTKGLMLLAINIDASSSEVSQFLQTHELSLSVLLGAKTDVAAKYNIRYIPTTFFIDKDGIIQAVKVGAFANKETIEAELSKIMP
jgi:thiol-disulfide isomerase/thioredoxin